MMISDEITITLRPAWMVSNYKGICTVNKIYVKELSGDGYLIYSSDEEYYYIEPNSDNIYYDYDMVQEEALNQQNEILKYWTSLPPEDPREKIKEIKENIAKNLKPKV